MTNGEKLMQDFPSLQIDEGELDIFLWLPCHDAIDIPLDWWNEEYKEPNCSEIPTGSITKTCRTCRNFGSHHGICEICKNNKCWTEITKNDLGVDWESYKDVDGNSLDDLILEVLQNNFDCGNTYGYKVADKIIALLPSVTPQEPFINKPCVSGEVCEHDKNKVLDKLRAEIEQNAYPIVHGVNNHEKGMTLYGILQIIDKYKAEKEE